MKKIGIIAGRGRFPFLVAEEIRKGGDQVIAVGFKEETDAALEPAVDRMHWISLGQFQKLIDAFRNEGVSTAVMAGQVRHRNIYAGLSLDWRAIKLLGSLVNKKTDSILGAVAAELAKEGIELLPSHSYLKHLLPAPGVLAGSTLSKAEKDDIEFGHKIAKQIAGLDIGQTVVVKDRSVVAVESIEGTDECIRRAASLAGPDTIVVKVAKPSQDWRFDLPVIGPTTAKTMAENRVRALAVESGVTLLIDKEQLLEAADRNNITIVAL